MLPGNENRGRGRRKRRREPSHEERTGQTAISSTNFNPQSNISPSAASFDHHSPQVRSGTWQTGDYAPSAPESQYGQPVNIITSHPPPGKVAIPALRPPQSFESSSRGSKKGRISHACDACRRAKAGCTGEQPCARCKNAGITCVYGDGKREQDRKKMTKLTQESLFFTQHKTDVTEALRRIQLDTSLSPVELRAAVDEVIAMNLNRLSPDSRGGSFEPSQRPSTGREMQEPSDEEDADEQDEDDDEVGSTGALDVINVDTDRDEARATGHLGKASAVSWAKRTNEEMRRSGQQENVNRKSETGRTFSSYHVEDADVEHVDVSNVNLYDWPEYGYANTLVQTYFDHTHQAFPVLDRAKFMVKYSTFPRGANNLDTMDSIWLGTLNVIFAISSVFKDLTNRENEGHADNHTIYCARAKGLCMDESFLFKDARLSTTSFLGLMSLYYISICKLNRAWTICGLAIRQGLTLGLHVRSEVKDLQDIEKEHRVRLWWSLYSLEVLLNELTGRPSCICDRDISTPLPVNIGESDFVPDRPLYRREDSGQLASTGSSGKRISKGRPAATYEMPVGYSHPIALSFPVVELPITSSTFFIYRTQLSIISHEIVTQLYCAATIKEKWSDVQETIRTIDARLLTWRDSLPKELDVIFDVWKGWEEPDWNGPYTLPRIALALSFNSSRMILFRPCLCRIEGRLKKQPQASRDFEQEAAEHCIRSARHMISLLKWSAKSESRFYSISPWWTTLHYLCEALSVLMLEMAFGAEHLPSEAADMLEDAKQGILWLVMLSAGSIAARKAWEIFDNLVRLVSFKINWSVFDLPTTVSVPARYNWRRFGQPLLSDPWNHLSRDKLQEYQATQPDHPAQDPTAAWTNVGLNQYFPERTTSTHFSNPLSSTAAVERFTNMGLLYGHYDEPWQQLFAPAPVSPMGIGSRLSGPAPQLGGSPTSQTVTQARSQLGAPQLGGSQIGGSQIGGSQIGGSQIRGSQIGGSQIGGSYVDGSHFSGSQLSSGPSGTTSGSSHSQFGAMNQPMTQPRGRHLTQASFDCNVGAYETLGPTSAVDTYQQQRDFQQQQQEQEDMQREQEFEGF